MRILRFFTILILFIACSTSRTGYNKMLQDSDPTDTWIVAHRALTGENIFPENSIPTILSCMEHGLDVIEIDVRETKDSQLVIMHDKTIDRTTNGKGKVSDLTLADLRKLRLLHQGKPTDYQIPTLEEVLRVTKNKILIDLDIKLDTILAYKKIVDLVDEYHMQNQMIYFLYDQEDIKILKKMSNQAIIMPRARSLSDVGQIFKKYNYISIIHLDENSYDNQMMKNLIAHKKRVWMNSLGEYDQLESNGQNGFQKFFKTYPNVNVVQTDLGFQLKKFLADRKLNNL